MPFQYVCCFSSLGRILKRTAAILLIVFSLSWPMALAAKQEPITGLTVASSEKPLSFSPLLSWRKNSEAVCYEMEIFSQLPTALSPEENSPSAAWRSSFIFFSYFNPPLFEIAGLKSGKPFWYRVRPLDFAKRPIAPYSDIACVYTSPKVKPFNSPLPLSFDGKPLLYPAYSWIKPFNAEKFIVEIYDDDPARNNKANCVAKLTSNMAECYDESPRTGKSPLYWRVQAFRADGQPVGDWSCFMELPLLYGEQRVAVFGDSISHGGGHLSYGPEDAEYSYLTYLDFPCANLSKSSDTSQSLLARFEADVLPFSPRYLIILGGSNDLRAVDSDVAGTIANLSALADRCRKNGIRPIFLTLPPINPAQIKMAFGEETDPAWREKFDAVNKYIRENFPHIEIARTLEEYSPSRELAPWLGLDGLHPDIVGKKTMAARINFEWKLCLAAADAWWEDANRREALAAQKKDKEENVAAS